MWPDLDYSRSHLCRAMLLQCGTVLPVVVKSHQRCNTFAKKSFRLLQDNEVCMKGVHVFVSTSSDVVRYNEQFPGVNVYKGPRGLANVDRTVSSTFREGEFYIQLVDDMTCLKKLCGQQLVRCKEIRSGLSKLYAEMVRTGASYGGFAPVKNAKWMSHEVMTHLVLVMESFCIIQNRSGLLPRSHSKINFDRTLRHFHSGGGIVRLNNYVADVSYYTGEGGMTGRDKQTEMSAARSVQSMYKQYVSRIVVRRTGKTSLQFKSGVRSPIKLATEAASIAARAANRGDARLNPACPQCSARGTSIIQKTAGQWYCKACPYKFRTTEYANARRKAAKKRKGDGNCF